MSVEIRLTHYPAERLVAPKGNRRFLGAELYPNKPAAAGRLSGTPVRPSE